MDVAEKPVTFTVPLKEQTITEGDSVTLVCEVSKENATVQWLKDGKPITPDEHMQVTVEGTDGAQNPLW